MRRSDDVLFVRGRHTEWRKTQLPLHPDLRVANVPTFYPNLLDPEPRPFHDTVSVTVYELREFALGCEEDFEDDTVERFPVYVMRGLEMDEKHVIRELLRRRHLKIKSRHRGRRVIEGWHLFLAVLTRMK